MIKGIVNGLLLMLYVHSVSNYVKRVGRRYGVVVASTAPNK